MYGIEPEASDGPRSLGSQPPVPVIASKPPADFQRAGWIGRCRRLSTQVLKTARANDLPAVPFYETPPRVANLYPTAFDPLNDRHSFVTGLWSPQDVAHDLWVRIQSTQAVHVIVREGHEVQSFGGKDGHREEAVRWRIPWDVRRYPVQ